MILSKRRSIARYPISIEKHSTKKQSTASKVVDQSRLNSFALLNHSELMVEDGEETVSHGQLARCQLARSLSTETRGGNCRHLMLHRNEGEGFGFIIISSLNRDGSTIGEESYHSHVITVCMQSTCSAPLVCCLTL